MSKLDAVLKTNCNICLKVKGIYNCCECKQNICNSTFCRITFQKNLYQRYILCSNCHNTIKNKFKLVTIQDDSLTKIHKIHDDINNLYKLKEIREMLQESM